MDHHPIYDLFKRATSVTSGDHLYDFLGTATRASYRRGWVKHAQKTGKSVTPPLPTLKEDYLDWTALLTSVARARGTFRMAELGAGWAPWLVRGALAAGQRSSIKLVQLLALEADPVHHSWITEHFKDNGIDPEQHQILHGAASGISGTLTFPVVAEPDVDYGASLRQARPGVPGIAVRGFTIPEILAHFSGPIDFLHVDIQASEYDVLPPAMAALKQGVKSILIRTHISEALHDNLVKQFLHGGWREVFNYPRSSVSATAYGDIKFDDGFLLFENSDFV